MRAATARDYSKDSVLECGQTHSADGAKGDGRCSEAAPHDFYLMD